MQAALLALLLLAALGFDAVRGQRACQMHERCMAVTRCPPLARIVAKGPRITAEEKAHLRAALCGWGGQGAPQVCCPLLPVDECGALTYPDRIIGGNMTVVMEFPWAARLGYRARGEVSFRCGGALISDRYVVTAAHCTEGRQKPVVVRLGEHDAESEVDCSTVSGRKVCAGPAVDVDVEEVIEHPEYEKNAKKPTGLWNDIALIRLKRPVDFSDSVKPICLPFAFPTGPDDAPVPGDASQTVVGWGRISQDEFGESSRYLLKLRLREMDHDLCQEKYKTYPNRVDSQRQVCAIGRNGQDVCHGDSGGPLSSVVSQGGRIHAVLKGVVSFGPNVCATNGVPGVFSRVTHYLPWIVSKIRCLFSSARSTQRFAMRGLRVFLFLVLAHAAAAQWMRPVNVAGERQCPLGRMCLPLQDCAPLSGLAQRGKQPTREDVLQLQQAHCGFAGVHPMVCCPSGPSAAGGSPPSASGSPAALATANLRLLPLDECGPVSADRIIGGKEAQVMELPWMARLGYRRDDYSNVFDYNCGGSLISDRYVLTAAHCINENTGLIPVSVRLGEQDASSEIDCSFVSGEQVCAPPPVDVVIERIIKHKNYGENRFQNDIALLRLARAVEFTDFVKPICLPVDAKDQKKDLTGKKVMVAGWGRVANRNGAGGSKVLMKVSVPVSKAQDCANAYVPLQLVISSEKQMCAGDTGKDSCQGDSGGPLTTAGQVKGTPRVVQQGIVSFGPSHCATEGTPGVYTKVAHYVPWIVQNIEP
ncbi:uncharacterized protein LOC117651154 [Thrips palmi]|uniref:limulus clotting factor C n=1 Tax=Thrips palmi TaxID=161013 RepID=A0A6P9A0J3_THRPL|nr:uncharacterized protein LOC117651154 [Thrips palmi]